MASLDLATKIALILDEKKATDIRVLNIREQTTLGDYFVLASGGSTTQTKSLCDELEHRIELEDGVRPRRTEGYQSASWILMDYTDVIVHIFHKETREFYSLERLWSDGMQVEIPGIGRD